jgi:hypothetical protein
MTAKLLALSAFILLASCASKYEYHCGFKDYLSDSRCK